jgi:hypothetical protein
MKYVPKATVESDTTPEANAAKHLQFSEQVETWCADVSEITRKTVALLADELKGSKDNAPNRKDDGQNGAGNPGTGEAGEFVHEQIPGSAGQGNGGGTGVGAGEGGKTKPASKKTEDGFAIGSRLDRLQSSTIE